MTVGTASLPSYLVHLSPGKTGQHYWMEREELAFSLWRVKWDGTFGFTREGAKKHISSEFHASSTILVCGTCLGALFPLIQTSNYRALDHHSKVNRQEDGPWSLCF